MISKPFITSTNLTEKANVSADTVVLASMGRSGSTFLANIINCENKYRILFEPFFSEKVSEAIDFVYPLYLRPDVDDHKYLAPAQMILGGYIHSPWIDKECGSGYPDQLLIKDIRINLFLKWLHNKFHQPKIILLLRHPCAVVQSWLACNFGDGTVARERILSSTSLMEDYVTQSIRAEYAKADTAYERLVFFWCLYNQVPLHQFKNEDICVVFYENLFLDAEVELSRLFSFLGMAPSQIAIDKAMTRPSSTTLKNSEYLATNDNVNGWRKMVSATDVRRAYEIMAMFGMETLYCSETSVPNRSSLRFSITADFNVGDFLN